MQERAERIAHIIASTNTDNRGNLFVLVGEELRRNGQGFTGTLLINTGKTYGINPTQGSEDDD